MADDRAELLVTWAARCLGVPLVRLHEFLGGAGNMGYRVLLPDSDTPVAFLRTKYGNDGPGSLGYSLHREGVILRTAARLGFPVAPVLGTLEEPDALLMGFVEGDARPDAVAIEAVAPKYLALIARLHAADAADFPVTPRATMADAIAADFAAWCADAVDRGVNDLPLLALAERVLREQMPGGDGPPALVHGDVGAGNFLTLAGEVSAILDWELAHLGDPHEDLAWLWMRGAHTSFGDPQARFAEYEAASGRPLDRARLDWNLALVMWKSLIALHGRLRTAVPGELAMVHLIVALTYDALLAAQLVKVLGGSVQLLHQTPQLMPSIQANLAIELLTIAPLEPDQRVVLEHLRDAAALGDWLRDELARDCRDSLGIAPTDLTVHVQHCPADALLATALVLAHDADRRALTSPKSVRRIDRALTIGLGHA